MISQGSCDAVDWSNGCFAITGIHIYFNIILNVKVILNCIRDFFKKRSYQPQTFE